MRISAKTTLTSLVVLFAMVLAGGLVAYFSVIFIFNNLRTSDAEKRMEFLEASILEDSLMMKDRAAKAGLTADPAPLFPGITYCDVFVYGNPGGDVIESYVNPRFFSMAPKKILTAYIAGAEEAPAGDVAGERYGVMKVGDELILFGSAPARPETFLIVGKVIDAEYAQQLTRLNEYAVTVSIYNETSGPEAAAAKIELAKGKAVYMAPGGGEWTTIYGLLRDQAGHPVGLIRAVNNTATWRYGFWIIFGSIALMFAVGLGVMIANIGGVRLGVSRRVKQARSTIKNVRESSDLSRRIEITGRDDLSELNEDINEMLAHLEESVHREFTSQQLYTKLAEATHNMVIVFGPDMKIDYINSEASAEFGESPDDIKQPDWVNPLRAEQQRRDRKAVKKVFNTGVSEHMEEEREFEDSVRWMDTWLVPIKDESDKVVKVLVSSLDITERKIEEEKMARARDFYIYLFNNFPNPVWRVDASGRCNYVNKAAISFTGKEEAQLMNDGWQRSVHKDDAAGRARLLEQAAKTKTHTEIEYRMRGYDGTYRWVIDYVQPIYNLRNRFAGFYGAIIDVTERRLKSEELAYMATHDVLTNTVNRRRFDEEIENAVAKAKRGETSALLFLDLDDFKSVNDAYGHQEGDKALAAVAATARRVLRKEDLLARLGGDEFAVILEGQSLEAAISTANRLTASVKKNVKVNSERALTISIGLTAMHEKTAATKAMAEADAAMYEAKRRGGNRALVFELGFMDYNY